MRYAVLSDVHGNLCALERVLNDMEAQSADGLILLGDLIDYGMRSNEVIYKLSCDIQIPVVINIWGNHERAVMCEDYTRFSSERGVRSAQSTASHLTRRSREYLDSLNHAGFEEFELGKLHCLAVHGSMEDHYWKSISPNYVSGSYEQYDMVFSGHSHCSHYFSRFYPVEEPRMRNEKSVLFLNPGSVGQPRNHNPAAQYAIFDTDTLTVSFQAVPYDIRMEQSFFFGGDIDEFYCVRLERGI